MLKAGPKEDPLDFHRSGNGKRQFAEKRPEPGQSESGTRTSNMSSPRTDGTGNTHAASSAAKLKQSLQAGQALDKNSTAKGTDASQKANAGGAEQARQAKAQIQQLKQTIKQDQTPQENNTPSPGQVAAGSAITSPVFTKGAAMMGMDMGLVGAGMALWDIGRFASSFAQSEDVQEQSQPQQQSPLAGMPGVETVEPEDDAAVDIETLEAQEAELASIEKHYSENQAHHEWREDKGIDYHDIEAPAGTCVNELNAAQTKPDQFDIDYVGMNLRDVQLKYAYDNQPKDAACRLSDAVGSHSHNIASRRGPASEDHELPPPELARLGQLADQVMGLG